ncbi:MAG: hypothetical protein K2I33_02720 [Oscillospiraceae bacterium]|nr:hypothetical protein [Oscillospiraceae bacterium]
MKKYLSALICGTVIFASSALSVHGVNYIENYDINKDGYVNSTDIVVFNKILIGAVQSNDLKKIDVNNNGVIDELDKRTSTAYILGFDVTITME